MRVTPVLFEGARKKRERHCRKPLFIRINKFLLFLFNTINKTSLLKKGRARRLPVSPVTKSQQRKRQLVSKTNVFILHADKEYANALLKCFQRPVASFHFRPRTYLFLVVPSLQSVQVKHFVFPTVSIPTDYTQTSEEDVFDLD